MKITCDINVEFQNGIKLNKKAIKLLKAIDEQGSITLAAKELGISYKNAWDSLNELASSLLERKKNSGTKLSAKAKELIKQYEQIQKIQENFLNKLIEENINLEFIPKFFSKLSARNELEVKITKIIEGVLNCDVIATLSSGEELRANITKSSQELLNLKVGDSVYFIFKAPKVVIYKDELSSSLLPNLLKAKITKASIGSQNSEIHALCANNQELIAIIPNDTTMDLRLCVNDEIGVVINPTDIIIAK